MYKKIPAGAVSVFVLACAIFSKLTLTYFFATLDTDKLYQALATVNLAHGQGVTLSTAHATNLSKLVFEPLSGWPMGYSLLLLPLYQFVSKNLFFCSGCIDVLAIVIFLISLRRILMLLDFPSYLVNVLLLLNGLAIPEYMKQSTPTDLPAMASCLWACCLLIGFVKNENKKNASGVFLGFINAVPGFLRYVYLPIGIIIPALLCWNGILKKDRRLLKAGIVSLLVTAVSWFIFFGLQKHFTGNPMLTDPNAINPAAKGFFPANLQYIHPFIYSSVLDLNFYLTQLSIHTGIPFSSWMAMARLSGLALLVPVLYLLCRYGFQQKLVWKNIRDVFFFTAGVISLATVLLLCYLSVTNSLLTNNFYSRTLKDFYWTYVQEGRYFPFVVVYLQVFFAWLFFIYKLPFSKKAVQVLRGLICILVTAQLAHGLYFIGRQLAGRQNELETSAALNKHNKQIIQDLVAISRNNHTSLVLASTNSDLCSWSVLCGGSALYHIQELNAAVIATDRPVTLVVALKEEEQSFFSAFFLKNGMQNKTRLGDYDLFTYFIQPIAPK